MPTSNDDSPANFQVPVGNMRPDNEGHAAEVPLAPDDRPPTVSEIARQTGAKVGGEPDIWEAKVEEVAAQARAKAQSLTIFFENHGPKFFKWALILALFVDLLIALLILSIRVALRIQPF